MKISALKVPLNSFVIVKLFDQKLIRRVLAGGQFLIKKLYYNE